MYLVILPKHAVFEKYLHNSKTAAIMANGPKANRIMVNAVTRESATISKELSIVLALYEC
ncbi:MAG: hypothetical protein ACNA7Q_09855 [Rhodobacterales bacterium]